MKAELIKLNGTYRMKPEVFANSIQACGHPFDSPDVKIVRISYPAGRKSAWYYDASGNAFRPRDFSGPTEVIDVEFYMHQITNGGY